MVVPTKAAGRVIRGGAPPVGSQDALKRAVARKREALRQQDHPEMDSTVSEERDQSVTSDLSDDSEMEQATHAPRRHTVSGIDASAAVAVPGSTEDMQRLRTQLQTMTEHVYFLHKMMQGLSTPEKQMLKGKHLHPPSKRLSFGGMSPVKKAHDMGNHIAMPDDKGSLLEGWALPAIHEAHHRRSPISSNGQAVSNNNLDVNASTAMENEQLRTKVEMLERENADLQEMVEKNVDETASSSSEYLALMDEMTEQLEDLQRENAEFRETIDTLEHENIRLYDELALLEQDALDNFEEEEADLEQNEQVPVDTALEQNEQVLVDESAQITDSQDYSRDELGIDGTEEVVEESHERCEEKIHELWQTIKTLKTYVQTFRVEIDDLTVQRDEAIESADRAWKENMKLAGSNNPQQRIKYLEAVKRENVELTQTVRDLQSKLAKMQARGQGDLEGSAGERDSGNGFAVHDDELSEVSNASEEESDAERTRLIKKMWAHNKKLEEEITRLQHEKESIVPWQHQQPHQQQQLSVSHSSALRKPKETVVPQAPRSLSSTPRKEKEPPRTQAPRSHSSVLSRSSSFKSSGSRWR